MVSEQVDEKIKAQRWVLVWAKDEKFWKDVAANTVAGILLAIILYVFAIIMGYIQDPGLWNSVAAFFGSVTFTAGISSLVGVLTALLSVLFAFLARGVIVREPGREGRALRRFRGKKLTDENEDKN